MALPKQDQMILRHQAVRGFTDDEMAECVDDKTRRRYFRLANGRAYVSPTEAKTLSEKFNGLPIETMFEAGSLAYINGPWPPRRGAGAIKDRLSAAEAELAALKGGTNSEILAPVGVTKNVTIVAIPDEYVDRAIAFIRGIEAR